MGSVAGASTGGGRGSGRFGRRFTGGQDFELNLAPIIDCMTVLIAFVLISASYISIGVLEAGVAASGATQTTKNDSPVSLALSLRRDHTIMVMLSGKAHRSQVIPAGADGQWNYNALTDHLAYVKSEWPQLKQAVLMADNEIDYREVVKSMEVTRKAVPSVFLGGF
jgi:biopolymer transport protein TolR